MLRFTVVRFAPTAPLKVLVLTMTPNGGAMTTAMRVLGYNPYIFENTYRTGNVMSHTKEWRAVLMRQKPFDPVILQVRQKAPAGTKKTKKLEAEADNGNAVAAAGAALKDFDVLVGPPATLAYESILHTCPRSTRVILVEEPDKLAWEKEYEQLLQPILQHTKSRGRLVGVVNDLNKMMDSMTEVRRTVSAQRKPNTSASAQKVGALQASALRLGAALDLFEAQVKETVPKDRLLVYRLGEGWGPLCAFLNLPVPTTKETGDGAKAEVVPFPPHDAGTKVFADLQDRLTGASRAALVAFLALSTLGLVLLVAFNTPVKRLMSRYHARFDDFLKPYFNQYTEEGKPITLRGALQLSKKATLDLEAEVREEGGVVTGFKDAIDALAHPYGSDDGAIHVSANVVK